MTPAQVDLLRRCIAADRAYRSKIAAGETASNDERGIEVGWINSNNPRTARALAAAGLIEIVDIFGHPWAFLGDYRANDPLETAE
jgi:hypothetical protein